MSNTQWSKVANSRAKIEKNFKNLFLKTKVKKVDIPKFLCTFIELQKQSKSELVLMPNHKISHKLRLYYYILGEGLTLTLGSTYFKRFKSSLQSHPLWVTL